MKRIWLLVIVALVLIAPGSASATFAGRNGRIAWAVWNAGGGGGGGYASLTSFPPKGGHGKGLGYCPEDDNGNVCENWYDVAYSPDGKQLMWNQADSSGHWVIVLAGPNAGHPTILDHETADDTQASFSPSGKRIVYVRQPVGHGGGFGQIVTSNISGQGIRVVAGSVRGSAPLFTPDGRHILFIRPDRYGYAAGLWSIGTGGHGLHRLIVHVTTFDVSPDGNQLAYVNGHGDLYVSGLDGSQAHRVAQADVAAQEPIDAVRFSPDGKLLAFAKPAAIPSVSAGGETLLTVPVAGGRAKVISAPGDYRTGTTGLAWQPLPR